MNSSARKPYDFTAAAYVVSDGRLLLVAHRKLRKWLPPGGHIARDGRGRFIESPAEAAVREVFEETGYRVKVASPPYTSHKSESGEEMLPRPESMHIHPIDEEHDHLGFDFLCTLTGEARGTGQEHHRWFTEAELEQYGLGLRPELPSHVRMLGKEAIRRLGQSRLSEGAGLDRGRNRP